MAGNVVNISKFNWVGFDLDHTVIRYRLPNLYRLIYTHLSRFLVEEKGYDRSLLDPIGKQYDLMQKGIILDSAKGNFLKLASNGYILRAVHGTHPLSGEEIAASYGEHRIWEHHSLDLRLGWREIDLDSLLTQVSVEPSGVPWNKLFW